MIEVCKLLFDFFFYYTVSGFYLYIFTETRPSSFGILILAAAVVIYVFVKLRLEMDGDRISRDRINNLNRILCCALPISILLFRPTVWQLVQYLPAWGFLGFSVWTGSLHIDKTEFREHFGFTGKLLLLILPGFISFSRCGAAFDGAVIYLVGYLAFGISLMRMLREEGKLHRGQTLAMLLALFCVSLALFALQALDLLTATVGFLYKNIIAQIFLGIIYALSAVVYGIIWVFQKLRALFSGNSEPITFKLNIDIPAEQLLEQRDYVDNAPPTWLIFLGCAALALVVCGVVFLIFRRLRGKKNRADKKALYTESRENLQTAVPRRESGLLRPKEPRLAVRWYYRKFLREGLRRGAAHGDADTSLAVAEKYSPLFSPSDGAEQLRGVYIGARYNENATVPQKDADKAAALWRELKKSKVKPQE